MSDVKHTPGPWAVIPAREYDGDYEGLDGSYTSPAGIEGANGDPVCVFGTAEGSGHLFENEADYPLIAAAPEMLEALEQALLHIEVDETTHGRNFAAGNVVRAAIAKATGGAA